MVALEAAHYFVMREVDMKADSINSYNGPRNDIGATLRVRGEVDG